MYVLRLPPFFLLHSVVCALGFLLFFYVDLSSQSQPPSSSSSLNSLSSVVVKMYIKKSHIKLVFENPCEAITNDHNNRQPNATVDSECEGNINCVPLDSFFLSFSHFFDSCIRLFNRIINELTKLSFCIRNGLSLSLALVLFEDYPKKTKHGKGKSGTLP